MNAGNGMLASCTWGPVTANGVDLLTEIYVIPKFRSVGPSAVAGEVETHGRKARKYIRISLAALFINHIHIYFLW